MKDPEVHLIAVSAGFPKRALLVLMIGAPTLPSSLAFLYPLNDLLWCTLLYHRTLRQVVLFTAAIDAKAFEPPIAFR